MLRWLAAHLICLTYLLPTFVRVQVDAIFCVHYVSYSSLSVSWYVQPPDDLKTRIIYWTDHTLLLSQLWIRLHGGPTTKSITREKPSYSPWFRYWSLEIPNIEIHHLHHSGPCLIRLLISPSEFPPINLQCNVWLRSFWCLASHCDHDHHSR